MNKEKAARILIGEGVTLKNIGESLIFTGTTFKDASDFKEVIKNQSFIISEVFACIKTLNNLIMETEKDASKNLYSSDDLDNSQLDLDNFK